MYVCWIGNYLKDIRKNRLGHIEKFLSATFTFRYNFGGYGRIKGEGNLEMPIEWKKRDVSNSIEDEFQVLRRYENTSSIN